MITDACGLVRLTIPIISNKTMIMPKISIYHDECFTSNTPIFRGLRFLVIKKKRLKNRAT